MQFIDNLHRHENCTNFIHDFINLIQQKMLMVDPRERHSCDQVKTALDKVYNKCREDIDYASKRNPWRNGNKQTSEGFPYSTKLSPLRQADGQLLCAELVPRQLERRKSGLSIRISTHQLPI